MIALVEKAMLARLKAAADAGELGYAWRTLESYPEDWDAYLKNEAAFRAPAAWAVFGGIDRFESSDAGGGRAICTFGLAVAAENLRNEAATRHGVAIAGKPGEPGSYQLLVDAIRLLAGQDFGLDIDALEFVEAQFVPPPKDLGNRHVSLIALRFETAIGVEALAFDAAAPAPFTRFHANWDVPAFGNLAAPLPADATADATDSVELEQ